MDNQDSDDSSVKFLGELLIIPRLGYWHFDEYFGPMREGPFRPHIDEIGLMADESGVQGHKFFEYASSDRRALEVWAAQEAVVTNAFSQLLLICCAQIKNVHARAAFMPVIGGEHHQAKDGIAEKSHPWLLKKLCESLGVPTQQISPAPYTIRFLKFLTVAVADPLVGLGALGVGNERMLIPEYTAVRNAFGKIAPDSAYAAFLDSNIAEDVTHNELLQDIAASLIDTPQHLDRYRRGAHGGVAARMAYYDELLAVVSSRG